MDSQHLGQDEFFDKLGELFHSRRGSDHGAIYLAQKRLTYNQDCLPPTAENPMPDLFSDTLMPVIVRATNGKSKVKRVDKLKLSTIVQPQDLDSFYTRYAEVCKAGMTALKPRDRSKKKAKAKKKKIAS